MRVAAGRYHAWLRPRDALLVLLAVTTGATDATAFERLGHTFASVITGNLVLLGVGAAAGDGRVALLSGVALAGYAVGVMIAAPRRGTPDDDSDWPHGTTVALTGDLACLVVFAVGWEITNGRPGRTSQALLLALAGLAMGMQSTAVRRLGNLSTTYLTSTYTGLLEALAARRWSDEYTRSIGILLMAFGGAAAATGLVLEAPVLVPALQLLPLGTVVALGRRVSPA
jgi:uncharacterized membrane protein YoaK (UPF0700 family)